MALPETHSRTQAGLPESQHELADRYLRLARQTKFRRLAGLITLCVLLIAALITILANQWYSESGGGGAGWVFVGIAVAVCAIGGVVVDIVYRREL